MDPLVIIPCRSDSKGIPCKNFKDFRGQPLYQWTLDTVEELGWPYVFSTDGPGVALLRHGNMIVRPTHMGDLTPMVDVVRHVIDNWVTQAQVMVLLQPTHPYREAETIKHVVSLLVHDVGEPTGVTAVTRVPQAQSRGFQCYQTPEGWLDVPSATRRQDTPPSYLRSGYFYVFWKSTVIQYGDLYGPRCLPYIHEPLMGHLDTMEDWERESNNYEFLHQL